MTIYPSFRAALADLGQRMKDAPATFQARWQGVNVVNDPSAKTYELMNVVFQVPLSGCEDLSHWQKDIGPNLPWADDHFRERVGGEPLNPGEEWKNWPWAASADRFRDGSEVFNHTYSERLWPKYARRTPGGKLPKREGAIGSRRKPVGECEPEQGVVLALGDLDDLVGLLVRDPYTRQAWIPLFFPEDTGWADGGRKPCTLGYQFIRRNGLLHLWYPLRSCDFVRHFRDDCYLAVRLLLWVLDECRKRDRAAWYKVQPGTYSMWMTSLHVFENDRRSL